MSKSNYFFGQSVLCQVFSLIPKHLVQKVADATQSDFAIKKFDTYHHLFTMCYAAIGNVDGLRHICDGLLGMSKSLSQLGITYIPTKSTLGDSNKNRESDVFAQIYMALYKYYHKDISDRVVAEPLLANAYAIDSSTMSLFKAILKACGRKSKDGIERGGIKAHVQISLIDDLPMNIKFTSSATHDHVFLKDLKLEKNDIAIFDKGYVDYAQYAEFTDKGIYFVTREKDNALSTVLEELELADDKDFEILLDEKIEVKYKDLDKKDACQELRRTVVWSTKHAMQLVLLSNMFHLEASQISLLYRKRWRIELLFKQLKQNFPLKYFVGDNQNAIEVQIWCVLIANLLLTFVKQKVTNRAISFALVVSIVRQHCNTFINVIKYLNNPDGLRRQYINEKKVQKTRQAKLVFNTS